MKRVASLIGVGLFGEDMRNSSSLSSKETARFGAKSLKEGRESWAYREGRCG